MACKVLTHSLKLSTKPSKWAIQTTKPLDVYAKGRVLLLGDAVSLYKSMSTWPCLNVNVI